MQVHSKLIRVHASNSSAVYGMKEKRSHAYTIPNEVMFGVLIHTHRDVLEMKLLIFFAMLTQQTNTISMQFSVDSAVTAN